RDAVARDVRVGVPLVRYAVRRPARVRNTEVSCRRVGGQRFGELRDLADGAQARDLRAPVQDGNAGRAVAAVLEPLQALDQDRDDVPVSDRSDDAAHGLVTSRRGGPRGTAVAPFYQARAAGPTSASFPGAASSRR